MYNDFNNLVVLVLTGWWLQNLVLRSIYLKSRFRFLAVSCPFLPHSWQKVQGAKILIFSQEFNMGTEKKNVMLRSNPLKKITKTSSENMYQRKINGELSFYITKTKDFILRSNPLKRLRKLQAT
jgi:hypothetical protein